MKRVGADIGSSLQWDKNQLHIVEFKYLISQSIFFGMHFLLQNSLMHAKPSLSHFSCLLLTVNLRGLLSSLFILSVGFAVFNPIKTVFHALVSVFVYFMHVAVVLMFYLVYCYVIAFKTI